jgi:hypothetical protein
MQKQRELYAESHMTFTDLEEATDDAAQTLGLPDDCTPNQTIHAMYDIQKHNKISVKNRI